MVISEPQVSIIVLVYNIEKFLPACINSIIGQTYQNFQAILIDDGATDSSGKICDDYASLDNRIKVVHKQNEGTNLGRRTGVEFALKNSPIDSYVTFIDGDDTVTDNYVRDLVDGITSKNADVSIGKYQYFYEDGSVKQTGFLPHKDILISDNKRICLSTIKSDSDFGMKREVWCGLYPLRFFKKIDWELSDIKIADDTMLLIQVLAKAKSVYFIKEPIYNFLQRANSFTNSSKVKVYQAVLESNNRIVNYLFQTKGYDFKLLNRIEDVRNYLNLIGCEVDMPRRFRSVDISEYVNLIKSIKYRDIEFRNSGFKQKFAILLVKLGGVNLYGFFRKITVRFGITQNFNISNLSK